MKKERKIEGYWRNGLNWPNRLTTNLQYPDPIPNVLSSEEAEVIYDLIISKEKEAKVIPSRGFSCSRITGEALGNLEYQHSSGWIWPGDFASHYVKKHKVKPTDGFLKFIGYKI